jgi:hypothetical protein
MATGDRLQRTPKLPSFCISAPFCVHIYSLMLCACDRSIAGLWAIRARSGVGGARPGGRAVHVLAIHFRTVRVASHVRACNFAFTRRADCSRTRGKTLLRICVGWCTMQRGARGGDRDQFGVYGRSNWPYGRMYFRVLNSNHAGVTLYITKGHRLS